MRATIVAEDFGSMLMTRIRQYYVRDFRVLK